MGLRFRRRIRLAPGLRLNLSRRGASVSVGGPGATVNLGRNKRVTLGVPGTGLSYGHQLGHSRPRMRFRLGLAIVAIVLALYLLGRLNG